MMTKTCCCRGANARSSIDFADSDAAKSWTSFKMSSVHSQSANPDDLNSAGIFFPTGGAISSGVL